MASFGPVAAFSDLKETAGLVVKTGGEVLS